MPKKILIIDDEEDMQIYIETILRKAGFDTEVAANGEEALQLVRKNLPDLITLDILMPRKSGITFFETLCKDENMRNIPVIVISGISGNNEFFENEQFSVNAVFMEKPIKPEELIKNVEKLINK